jgi:UDP-N-acetylglucosamine 2-epimerase (non-hydrolysing)
MLAVVGTRPEAIKMAPVILRLREEPGVSCRVLATAQHREMLDQVLELFGIVPDHDLDVMAENQTPARVAAAVLERTGKVLEEEKPDWVLVQGDTTTVAAAALAAFYGRCRVGHVEAGLRSFDRSQPFPEEINRKVAGVIADVHFAPTARARQNLLGEGVSGGAVHVTGNPVIDALHLASDLPWEAAGTPLEALPGDRRLVLVTAHRRENFGQPLERICRALARIADTFPGDVHVVYPVHPNPNVRRPVERLLGNHPGVTLTGPLDYLALVHLMRRACLILTDSGGIQEEGPALGKPVLVLREVTERPEAVKAGTVLLAGTDDTRIVYLARALLTDPEARARMARAVNPYGDGRAAERIRDILLGRPVRPFDPGAPGEE